MVSKEEMTEISKNNENNIHKQFNSDVVVVGAGIGGLCFARDIASLGYKVTIVERSSRIGGVWATNNYAGLRLHSPGAAYRCLSVVPSWNLNHDVSENYRPTRDEVLEYCHQLAEHENINILFNTNCNHKDHTVLDNGGISVELAGKTHTARLLFASGTFSNHWTGTPKFPPGFEGHPQSIHSSRLTKQKIKDIQDGKGQVVIVGASKAALDILQLFPARDPSVLWAHRGHTAFFPRVEDKQLDYAVDTLMHCKSKASEENKGRHWSEVALELGLLHKCKGPITEQKVKCVFGICGTEEIAHADTFKQFDLASIESQRSGIALVGKTEETQLIGEESKIIFCTGQQNHDFCIPAIEKGYISSAYYSSSITLSSTIPLCLGVQQLQGHLDTSFLAQTKINEGVVGESMLASSQSGREVDANMVDMNSKVNSVVLRGWPLLDPAVHPNWYKSWYSQEVSIQEFFQAFGVETSVSKEEVQYQFYDETASSKVLADLIMLLATIFEVEEEEIGALNEFQDFGMISIKWAELGHQIIGKFGIELSVIDMYKCLTVQDLAAVIEEKIRLTAAAKETPMPVTDHPQVSSFGDDTEALKGWFLQEKGQLPKVQTSHPIILFCFMGLGGNSEVSIRKISTEFNGQDIIPFVAIYPWEKNSERQLDNKAMDAKHFVKGICQAISATIQHGYSFALFGHSAGASMVCLVEEQLRTVFDLSPLVTIVANAIPPQLLTITLNRRWLSRIIASMWEGGNETAAYMKHQIKLSFDFWVDVFHCSKKAWGQSPPTGRFLVIGGDADRLVPCFVLRRWMKPLKNVRIALIEGGGHLCSVDPTKEGYAKTWGIIRDKILKSRAIAPSVGSEFGPLRLSLLSLGEDELFFFKLGLVSSQYRINSSFTFDGNISVAILRERAERVVFSDPRFIRFRSRISAEKKCFEPIANWSPDLHIDLAEHVTDLTSSKLWSIAVEHQCDRTIINCTFHHAIGDGYCCREFATALLGTSQDMLPPKIRLPPIGSRIMRKRFRKEIESLQEKYPLGNSNPSPLPTGTVQKVELCNLSLASVKAYAKSRGGGSVNDVLLMMISEIKRRLNESHQWVFSTVANRSSASLSDLRNKSIIVPMFVGANGQLATIRDYTKKFKFLLAHDLATGSSSLSSILDKPLDNSAVNLLTNMVALQNGNVGGHKLLEQRHFVTKPGMIAVGSMGDLLTCTYTVEECDMATIGKQVQEHWASIAIDMKLTSNSGFDQQMPLMKSSSISNVSDTSSDKTDLEDYHELHNMTCSMEHSECVLQTFRNTLIIPHSLPEEHLKKYITATPSAKQYYDFTISTRTRQATLDGQTSRLVAENVDVANPVTYTAKSDKQLFAEPYVFDFLKNETKSTSLKIIRHYEYQFGGRANILMMALHIELEDGRLVLLEIVKDLELQK